LLSDSNPPDATLPTAAIASVGRFGANDPPMAGVGEAPVGEPIAPTFAPGNEISLPVSKGPSEATSPSVGTGISLRSTSRSCDGKASNPPVTHSGSSLGAERMISDRMITNTA